MCKDVSSPKLSLYVQIRNSSFFTPTPNLSMNPLWKQLSQSPKRWGNSSHSTLLSPPAQTKIWGLKYQRKSCSLYRHFNNHTGFADVMSASTLGKQHTDVHLFAEWLDLIIWSQVWHCFHSSSFHCTVLQAFHFHVQDSEYQQASVSTC